MKNEVEKIIREWLNEESKSSYVDDSMKLSSVVLDGWFDVEDLVEQLTTLLTNHTAQIVERIRGEVKADIITDEWLSHASSNNQIRGQGYNEALRDVLKHLDQAIDIVKDNK